MKNKNLIFDVASKHKVKLDSKTKKKIEEKMDILDKINSILNEAKASAALEKSKVSKYIADNVKYVEKMGGPVDVVVSGSSLRVVVALKNNVVRTDIMAPEADEWHSVGGKFSKGKWTKVIGQGMHKSSNKKDLTDDEMLKLVVKLFEYAKSKKK